ncbi:retrovirus-related pol polyprotein from transposon TNT 1-94 [Tanacetum coccineum]
MKSCETCGSTVRTITDHNNIEWFRRGEAFQAKKVEALKLTKAKSSNANRSKTLTKSGCSRHMTGVKSYLHKYVEQPGPNVVFGDDSTCTTKGYGSIKCNGIVFTKVAFVNGLKYNLISISQLCDAKYIVQFDEKRGTIFNPNKEVVMIAQRVRDVYVLDMTSSAQESCFFAKASENLNWLWHKRLAHLNFKTINKIAKQNLVISLPSLVYSKDKPCLSCEKGKYHRASFKTTQTPIKKCIHLLHMDLFRPVTPRSINHEKYTLIIIDEYSRTDNGTEFKNNILINFCDEKGISQNFSSPYTPEQNSIAERKYRTLIEAARTILSGSVFSKQYLTEAVATDFRVFNTRRQQTEETYHITFGEIPNAIKFTKPLVDNINIVESKRYPPDEYLYPYETSQSTKDIQISKHLSSPNAKDTLVHDKILIPNPSLSIPSMVSPAPAMAKELSAASAHHECLFIDFLSEKEPKNVSEALKHPGWIDAMQDELNQFARNKVWTLVPAPYDKTIIGSKWVFRNKRDETGIVIKKRQDLYQANPKESHLIAIKRIFRYLKGTPSLGLWYPKCSCFDLKGYSDFDYAGCNMDRKSTSGACQLLGGKLVCWSAKKQQSIAMSSTKAEYVAVAGCCANILSMKSQLTDYDIVYEKVPIFCDNTSAIAISNNPVLHSRTKHFEIRYHFIRDHILKGDIELHFIPTQYQLADIFTKPLDEPTFKRLIVELGMLNINSKPEALNCLKKTEASAISS